MTVLSNAKFLKLSAAAANLVARCPPRKSYDNLRQSERLASSSLFTDDDDDDCTAREEFRSALLDALVSKVDQRVRSVGCPSSPSPSPHSVVLSEYNRDGDIYRCSRCDCWVTADGALANNEYAHNNSSSLAISFATRHIEKLLNVVVDEYARMYFANSRAVSDAVCTSSFVWQDSNSPSSTDSQTLRLGVAIFLTHEFSNGGEGEARQEEINHWCSTHVLSVDVAASLQCSYEMQSTVMLDVVSSRFVDHQRTQGFANTDTTRFVGKKARTTNLDLTSQYNAENKSHIVSFAETVVVEIVEFIQRVENALRDTVEALYFGKTYDVAAAYLRSKDVGAAVVQDAAIDAEAEATATSATASAAAATGKKKRKQTKTWEQCVDDEGNVYYYNTITGDTSWENPEAAGTTVTESETLFEPAAAADEVGDAPADAAVEEPAAVVVDEAAVVEVSVLDVLASLSLSQPAEQYHKLLKRYLKDYYGLKLDITTFLSLDDAAFTLGEEEDGGGEQKQVLEVLIPVFGDRRKVLKWIAKNKSVAA